LEATEIAHAKYLAFFTTERNWYGAYHHTVRRHIGCGTSKIKRIRRRVLPRDINLERRDGTCIEPELDTVRPLVEPYTKVSLSITKLPVNKLSIDRAGGDESASVPQAPVERSEGHSSAGSDSSDDSVVCSGEDVYYFADHITTHRPSYLLGHYKYCATIGGWLVTPQDTTH
jgi:hypothetical protein